MHDMTPKDRRVLKRSRELLMQMVGMLNASRDERKGARLQEENVAQLLAIQALWQAATRGMPEEHVQTLVDTVTQLYGECEEKGGGDV